MVTLHARISETADVDRTVVAIKERLRARFGIDHATVEIERADCADHHVAAAAEPITPTAVGSHARR